MSRLLAPELSRFLGCFGWPAGLLPVGVEPDGLDGIPVADPARPATGMAPTSFLVERRALREDGRILALVALGRGNEADGAVAMLMVVPLHEVQDPEAGLVQTVEAVYRIVRPVLAGAEQRFAVIGTRLARA